MHRGHDHRVRVPLRGAPAVRGDEPPEEPGSVRKVSHEPGVGAVHLYLRGCRDGGVRAVWGWNPRGRVG